ncbi:sugar ABC transporter ATP-binding protein [Asaia sp. VD9]|uniref:sugar ABC transporter ATP-binding protein n=1 Tax=Asaia sp. VD9 TaxID=3081235 RepID=UPI003016242D
MTDAVFLELRHVHKTFGSFQALRGIDWDVREGEIHCLVGENGCGKSTLIKAVSGVHAPDPGGEIRIGGRNVLPLDPMRARALGIQVVFQDLALFPNLNVAENIAFDANLGRGFSPRAAIRRKAKEILSRLGHDLPLECPVDALSIAERQIVAIARGLAGEARLIFMDEPTASLTRAEVRRLLDLVRKLSAEGIAIVFVSHRLDEVSAIAERITVMRDGRMVGTYPASGLDQRTLIHLMTGIEIATHHAPRDCSARPALLETRQLTRKGEYENVSITLHEGEVLGLTGLLGAGRTEFALSLFGMTRPDSGKMLVHGQECRFRTNQDALAAGLAYVSEDRLNLGINAEQSIVDNLDIAVLPSLANRFGIITDRARVQLARDWVARLNIKVNSVQDAINTLSGGNQQRVILARWLASHPKILILDSPTVGVDIKNKEGIYALIRELSAQGVGILVISDEMIELFATCDRILHMRNGRIAGDYSPAHITEQALEAQIYA